MTERLTDAELEAGEALIRAAIRWTDNPSGQAPKVWLERILGELRRYRGGRVYLCSACGSAFLDDGAP